MSIPEIAAEVPCTSICLTVPLISLAGDSGLAPGNAAPGNRPHRVKSRGATLRVHCLLLRVRPVFIIVSIGGLAAESADPDNSAANSRKKTRAEIL